VGFWKAQKKNGETIKKSHTNGTFQLHMFLNHEVDYINRNIPTVRNIKIQRQTYEIFTMKENLTVITVFKEHGWQFLVSPDSTTEKKSFAQYEIHMNGNFPHLNEYTFTHAFESRSQLHQRKYQNCLQNYRRKSKISGVADRDEGFLDHDSKA